jgi:ribosomal protein S17E
MSNQHLINLVAKNGKKLFATELALISQLENNNMVYLDNAYAMVEKHMTRNEFAGYISALSVKGKYEKHDSFFGRVITR